MIKGVTKNVIEIVSTNNKYYEKAVLFLKDSCPEDFDVSHFTTELFSQTPPSFAKRAKFLNFIKMAFATILGSTITAAVMLYLSLFV